MAVARRPLRPGARAARRAGSRTRAAAASAAGGAGDGWSTTVEDVDGAFRDWLLNRPADNIIVLRPDRYVAAICPLGHLEGVTARLRQILG